MIKTFFTFVYIWKSFSNRTMDIKQLRFLVRCEPELHIQPHVQWSYWDHSHIGSGIVCSWPFPIRNLLPKCLTTARDSCDLIEVNVTRTSLNRCLQGLSRVYSGDFKCTTLNGRCLISYTYCWITVASVKSDLSYRYCWVTVIIGFITTPNTYKL